MDTPNDTSKSWMIYLLIVLAALVIVLPACSTGTVSASLGDLASGSALRGEALFTQAINGAPPCATCHTLDGVGSVGPSFAGYSQRAVNRTTDLSAIEYTYYSITQPTQHVVSGYPNVMYARYGDKLSAQDIADLVAYVLSID